MNPIPLRIPLATSGGGELRPQPVPPRALSALEIWGAGWDLQEAEG